jgi:hypothetical protein
LLKVALNTNNSKFKFNCSKTINTYHPIKIKHFHMLCTHISNLHATNVLIMHVDSFVYIEYSTNLDLYCLNFILLKSSSIR